MRSLVLVMMLMLAGPATAEILWINQSDALLQARTALAKGRTAEASRHAENLIKSERRRLRSEAGAALRHAASEILCISERREGRPDQASRYCDAAIDLMPQNWRGYVNRGILSMTTGDIAAARADFRRARSLGGDRNIIDSNLGALRETLAGR